MIHEYDYVQDGQLYKAGVDVPEMASIVCTAFSGNLRNYELLAADVDKLPTYDNLMTGSSAYCIDTGEFYKYESTTKQWYKQ